jgi:outer membrane protein OmpA-like peptidoglycan-associated protein
MKQRLVTNGALFVMLLGLLGCETMKEHKVASGAVIGGAAGAVVGGVIGAHGGHAGTGAAIGAAAGAALGGGVGYLLDRQQKKYEQVRDVKVERTPQRKDPVTQKVEPEHLTLRMSSELLFAKNSSTLSPHGTTKVREIADILNQDKDSNVIVKGYASAEGRDAYNYALSQRRANMVCDTLITNGVAPARITTRGLGASNPIADNSTEAGRAMNRRVEIEVFPSRPAGQ